MRLKLPVVALVAVAAVLNLCVAEDAEAYTEAPYDSYPHDHKHLICAPGWGVPELLVSGPSYEDDELWHRVTLPEDEYYSQQGEYPGKHHAKPKCQRCPPGTFSKGGSFAVCHSCGPYQTSPEGSISDAYCSCQAGYGQAAPSDDCSLCDAGTYWPGPPTDRSQAVASMGQAKVAIAAAQPQSIQTCLACSTINPQGWTTVSLGATSQRECVCKPGFAGPLCAPCLPNQICPGGTRDAPKTCPPNSAAPVGATDVTECTICLPGTGQPVSSHTASYTEDDDGKASPKCQRCPAGTFSTGGADAVCELCGPYQTSPAGSTSSDFCSCQPGYGEQALGAGCSLCPLGSYWQGPPATLSKAKIQAVQGCNHCSTLNPSGGWQTLTEGAASSDSCVCAPGFAGPLCAPCLPNQICPGGTRDAPKTCPPNSAAPVGATDVTECTICLPGTGQPVSSHTASYTEDDDGKASPKCQRCPAGTFSTGGADAVCELCGPYQTSPAGSTSSDFCSCQAGYGQQAVDAGCSLCPLGSYWQGPPATLSKTKIQAVQGCNHCSTLNPSGGWQTLTEGATSSDSCVCAPGFAGPLCAPCLPNQICPGGTRDAPKTCPPNSAAPPGSPLKSITECVCDPGTGRPATVTGNTCPTCPVCDVCPPGTYSEGGTTDSCKQCNSGFTSPPGSDSPSDCLPDGQNLGYCCGTPKCATVVPQPPNELPARVKVPAERAPYKPPAGNATFPLPHLDPSFKPGVKPETVCDAAPLSEVAFPFNGIAAANVMVNIYFQDDTNSACPFNSGGANRVYFSCTGNLLAPHLVLTAANCVEPALVRAGETNCPNARLAAVVVCFNHNPGNQNPDYKCPVGPNTQVALGASWFPWNAAAQPYDQAIIFLPDARPGPYFQYNYIENINTLLPSNTWLARSYTGTGNAILSYPARCGCLQCPGIPCNLATSGPTTRAVVVEANGAFNAGTELCVGAGGSAVTVNGASCVVGTYTYDYPSSNPCDNTCSNFFSSISKNAPLTTLWTQIMVSTGNP